MTELDVEGDSGEFDALIGCRGKRVQSSRVQKNGELTTRKSQNRLGEEKISHWRGTESSLQELHP